MVGSATDIKSNILFRKLTRDVRDYYAEDVNLQFAIKAKPIMSGLKYSLAIGNWGQENVAGTRAGESQVQWNAKGQPIGRNSVRFCSYIGLSVRRLVPLTMHSWRSKKDKRLAVYKKHVWEEIQKT